MVKKILFLLLILMCSSCEIQYDGETRIVVQGQLIDKNNNPLSNKNIEIATYSGDFNASDLISYTKTDANGKFTLIFPAPKSEEIHIITSINSLENNEFQSKYISALKKNFSNYKLDFNTIILYENNDITQLDLILNQTSTNKRITEAHIEGLQAGIQIDLNADETKDQYVNTSFDVIKNQNVKLSYTMVDYSDPSKVVTTKNETVIAVNSEKITHVITY